MIRSAIVEREIDVTSVIDAVKSEDAGAVSVFIGTVRDLSAGRSVAKLEYEAYRAMAERELAAIVDQAVDKFAVRSIVAEHRVGELNVGDVSVAIASAHAHRTAAIESTHFVIEEIKKRVPIWKREHFTDGSQEWIDPTAHAEAPAP